VAVELILERAAGHAQLRNNRSHVAPVQSGGKKTLNPA
jgi:hypothetical protein